MIQVVVVQGDDADEQNPWMATVMLYHSWEEAIAEVGKLPEAILTQVTLTWQS